MIILGIVITIVTCGFAIGAIIVNNEDKLSRK